LAAKCRLKQALHGIKKYLPAKLAPQNIKKLPVEAKQCQSPHEDDVFRENRPSRYRTVDSNH
ncbi:hypothetical protein AB4344_17845, partial [Vibrio breoganii]